jgi:hypothetical protein
MNMYKKFVFFSAVLCTFTQHTTQLSPWLEVKPSYFLFCACPMNNIYDKGGFQVQGSTSVPVHNYFDVYGSIGYRQAWGHALNTCEKTTLAVIPIDIGLKSICNVRERGYCFLGLGPRFFYFNQDNSSPYVACNITGWGVGLFANTGFGVQVTDHFLWGIFAEYSYEAQTICPTMSDVYSNGSVQIGGVAVGISLGYLF